MLAWTGAGASFIRRMKPFAALLDGPRKPDSSNRVSGSEPRRTRNHTSANARGSVAAKAHTAMMPRAGTARLGSGTTMSGFKTHALPGTHGEAQKLPTTTINRPETTHGRASASRREIFKQATICNSATINYACADRCLTYFRLPYRPSQPRQASELPAAPNGQRILRVNIFDW